MKWPKERIKSGEIEVRLLYSFGHKQLHQSLVDINQIFTIICVRTRTSRN